MKKILITFCFTICSLFPSVLCAVSKKVIYIYNDQGVSKESLLQTTLSFKKLLHEKYLVKKINAAQVKSGAWTRDAILFVIPGGADLPYAKKLNGKGNQVIKKYVQDGGTFLGICAGSYYGSAYVEFDKNGPLEVLGDRELSFFKGKTIGPILASYDYKSQRGSRAATISTIFTELSKVMVYYNGGGFFENADKFPHTKIIATYENNLPAIISITYGNGKVLLSGVHFEYDPALLNSNDIYIYKIIKMLHKSNDSRKILFKQLMQIIGVN